MFKKVVILAKSFTKQISNNHISAYASSAAFFVFLSLIPILLLLCSIIPYTPITQANFERALMEILPEAIDTIAFSIVTELYGRSITIVSVTAVMTIWSGAKGIWALTRGLNVINDVEDAKGYVVLRLRSCFYTVILLVSIILSLVLIVYGDIILNLLKSSIPNSKYLMDFISNVKSIVVMAVLGVFFMALFTWLPNQRQRWYTQLPGAIFASVVWGGFSKGFSIYVNNTNGLTIYGSLTTIVIVMLWLYACMYIVLLGAMLNRFLLPANLYMRKRRKEERKAKNKMKAMDLVDELIREDDNGEE